MNIKKFSPVSNNLFLAQIVIERNNAAVQVRTPIHHYFLIDKSGSMYSTLPKVIEDLKQQVRNLQRGDAVTFGWFSSKREFGFPIKAFRIIDESGFGELDRLFDQHKRAMNLTCFSETLGEVGKVLDETAFLNMKNCLTFFSDGWANDSSEAEEKRLVRDIMQSLKGRFDLVLTVPYSDYADRAFLAEMANFAGGECISSARLHQFTEALTRFMRRAETSEPKIKISLGNVKPEFIFTFDSNPLTGGITTYLADENNDVYISPSENINDIYLIHKERPPLMPFGAEFGLQDELIEANKDQIVDYDFNAFLNAAYAAAVVLSSNDRQTEAIGVLGHLGDPALVERLGNAYTPSERANAEEDIRTAAFTFENRWKAGFRANCAPAKDAFCLLNLLEILAEDDQAVFYPKHPEFKYKPIGRKSIVRAGFPVFESDELSASPVSDFVWNSEFLNLSVRAKINGFVELPEVVPVDPDGRFDPNGEAALKRPDSLKARYPCFQWKNRALVKDGFLNVPSLPVSLSAATVEHIGQLSPDVFNLLYAVSVGEKGVTRGTLELDKIPVINQMIAENTVSSIKLGALVHIDEVLGVRLKTYKFLRSELDPKKEIVSRTEWTVQEQRYLTALGFSGDGSYSPPTDPAEKSDYYQATQFVFKIKGWSSIPKVDDVRDRLKSSKALNAPAQVIASVLEDFASVTAHFNLQEKLRWLDARIDETKKEQNAKRAVINKTKFAMVLAHNWFTDIPKTSDPITIDLGNDVKAIIEIKKKKVWI